MKPLGASGAWLALWPQLLTPRFSAVSITTFGPSTWQGTTSQPASTSAFAASASRTGSDQSPGKITCPGAVGVPRARPEQDGVDVAEDARDRFRRHEADLVGFGREAGGDAVNVMRLIEIAEIGAGVFRILVLVPERRGMAERDVGVFLGEVDDEGGVVAE